MAAQDLDGYTSWVIIGQGTFGEVYKAEKGGNRYALKRLNLTYNEILETCKKELLPLEKLPEHDYIVKFTCHFSHKDSNKPKADQQLDINHTRLWLETEYFPEGTMNDYLLKLLRNADVDVYTRQSRDFRKQISDAVGFLHDKGIVHGNLKPDNIMVFMREQTPIAKVADFGLAKACGNASVNWALMWYAAPEVLNSPGPLYTKESDIYSMGSIFAAMLDRTTFRNPSGKFLLAAYMELQMSAVQTVGMVNPMTVQQVEKVSVGSVQLTKQTINLSACIMLKELNTSTLKKLILRMMEYHPNNRPIAQEVKEILNSTLV